MRHLREVKKSAEFCGEERVTRSNIDDLPVAQVSPTNISQTAHNYSRNKGGRQQIQCESEYNFCFGLGSFFPTVLVD